jgi:predicted GIY-YIG superfamily endonuclease
MDWDDIVRGGIIIQTYIIKTHCGKYYCNKTDNVYNALRLHRLEEHPYFFSNKEIRNVFMFEGDHVARIKAFGVKRFMKLMLKRKVIPIF